MEASPLSQFVLLAKNAQGRACEALVQQALEHHGVFVFGELLDCPSVKALADSADGSRQLEMLRLFAYGTYPEYLGRKSELPELTQGQRKKLQMLTIVTLASKSTVIPFADLQVALDLPDRRELEDLVIESVYQGLIAGSMDQEKGHLEVETCASRDCREEDLDFIIDALCAWEENAANVMGSLDLVAARSREAFTKQQAARESLDELAREARETVRDGAGADGRPVGEEEPDDDNKRAKQQKRLLRSLFAGPSSFMSKN